MVDYHQALIPWIRSDSLIEFKKFLMRDQFAICSGLTLMIDVAGASAHVALVTPLDRISQSSSTTRMV